MTWREIRASFLEYFERNGHRVVPSSSLVPHDDPSLLFTNAGMNQFKDVFLGKEQRDYKRASSSQKCMRVSGKHNDLENVGPSPSHHTFFQMLGNFSFGDYFKKEAIGYAWELLTDVWKIPKDKLFVTVFKGEGGIPRDVEARDYWLKYVAEDHLSELGSDDNFWQMGETGPCGRCSEIYYFRGNQIPCPEPVCRGVECSCSRYIEIWNNVFMEFDRQASGELKPLPTPSIDTGMGLERLTAVLQGHESNYDTDLFGPILDEIGKLAGKKYGRSMNPDDVSMRVIADHARTTAFLIADGVMPSKEFRGYVLRKIMRRAMRHGMKLGITSTFLPQLVDVIVREMGDAYPELRSSRDTVVSVVRNEEERFGAVLAESYGRIENLLAAAEQSQGRQISGDDAFKLHDTFGVPLDFVEDVASERRITVDREGFERAMQRQQEKARSKSAFDARKGQEFIFASEESQQGLSAAGDRFEGYTTTTVKGTPVIALFDKERRQVKALAEGSEGYAALGQTPFYVEAGGQVSDVGEIHASGASAHVAGMSRIASGMPRLHRIQLKSGTLHERDIITAEVDAPTRDATRRNHTATHLLHAALRKVLGSHVKQAGSLVAPDRLRFDFVHSSPLAREQILEIEKIVNQQIYRNAPVVTEERSTQEAMASGAMALFGEKYGDRVRVVTIPGFSMELCGGTHCQATGDIGFFTIVSEGGVAAGVRRIEAVTGASAVQHHQSTREALDNLLGALGTTADRARPAVEHLQSENKRLAREISRLKVEGARSQQGSTSAVEEAQFARGRFVAQTATGLGKDELRQLADAHRDRIKTGVVVIGSVDEGRVSLVVAVTKDLVPAVHAGNIVKALAPVVGGRGGGRPDFAEAGGNLVDQVPQALAQAKALAQAALL